MRLDFVSAFFFPLLLIYSPSPAVAQLSVASGQPFEALQAKAPSTAQSSPVPKAVEPTTTGIRTDLKDWITSPVQYLGNSASWHDIASALVIASQAPARQCAHILIFQAPDVDSKMAKPSPRQYADNIPKLEGSQACYRDIRSAMDQGTGQFGTAVRIAPRAPDPVALMERLRP